MHVYIHPYTSVYIMFVYVYIIHTQMYIGVYVDICL